MSITKILDCSSNFINRLHSPAHFASTLCGGYFIWKTLRYIARFHLPQLRSIDYVYSGAWAIITGGSAGIGLALAEELAAKHINVILLARNQKKLSEAAEKISSKYDVKVKTYSIDASAPDDTALQNFIQEIGYLPICMLINNVATVNTIPADILDMPPEEMSNIINVNCAFTVKFTALVMPLLRHYAKLNPKRYPPTVVNISSLTSTVNMPLLSIYAASKAFLDHWSSCLASEVSPAVNVVCLRPGLTVSHMSGEVTPSLFCPSAQTMAAACIRSITRAITSWDSGSVLVPYGPHAILDGLNSIMPAMMSGEIVRRMHQRKREIILDEYYKHRVESESGK